MVHKIGKLEIKATATKKASTRTVYEGPKGGMYYLSNKRKQSLSKSQKEKVKKLDAPKQLTAAGVAKLSAAISAMKKYDRKGPALRVSKSDVLKKLYEKRNKPTYNVSAATDMASLIGELRGKIPDDQLAALQTAKNRSIARDLNMKTLPIGPYLSGPNKGKFRIIGSDSYKIPSGFKLGNTKYNHPLYL